MFRNRKNAQKPSNELYALFKQSFPHVGPGTVKLSLPATTQSITSTSGPLSDPIMDHRHFGDVHDNKHGESAAKGSNDEWRLTPSFLDSSAFGFPSFANQPPNYYTPSPGIAGNYYHSKAGDLHTPNLGFHLGTPLLPAPENQPHSATALEMHGFHSHLVDPHGFEASVQFSHQQSYAPSTFIHQDSGFDTMGASNNGSPDQDRGSDALAGHECSNTMTLPGRECHLGMPAPLAPMDEKFRYEVTLNAPTAMIKHAEEIPVTYLNKGQAYTLSIVDNLGSSPSPVPIKYRTVVRVSFEDEQQRQKPAACWQLWKEGRGLAEAHHRGGKLQAVEFVDPNQGGSVETKRPRVELETASFDCFSVTWTPAYGSSTIDCSVAVRFNFLSTDFSHSKGVKGIPVRLCVKTEVISSGTPDSPTVASSEVSFCKVKLFRDHGAERKLSNDVAHIKKTIDKIKQQIAQVEAGVKDSGKRKRSGSVSQGGGNRPSKVHKHKRTWSLSSQCSGGGRPALEDDLHAKLVTLQDMFSSTRPVSILHLRGDEQDDPDLYPVGLPGLSVESIPKSTFNRPISHEPKASEITTPTNSYLDSPSPSSQSAPSQAHTKDQSIGLQADFSPQQLHDEYATFSDFTNTQLQSLTGQITTSTASPAIRVQRGQSKSSFSEWIDVSGVDTAYRAPPERPVKPIACFYVLIKVHDAPSDNDCYRAVYLMERTIEDLITNVALKCEIDPSRISRALRINSKGLKIILDDEVVRELPEGQDMIVEFSHIEPEPKLKKEDDVSLARASSPLEMRLMF